jgi:hypothetical protein
MTMREKGRVAQTSADACASSLAERKRGCPTSRGFREVGSRGDCSKAGGPRKPCVGLTGAIPRVTGAQFAAVDFPSPRAECG